ncbi:DUF1772 domain-containing protein [Streptomyces sp. NPDC007088]|uniref:anthrone oxygenase family protein n=1 Tax=Streptomyces sp. NPDC007088 TaxID=3364773 RepID=UPI0036848369
MKTECVWQAGAAFLEGPHFLLVLAAAVCCGLVAGVFFAFSVSVMPALRQLPTAQGLVVMQRINKVIVNPLFLTVFLGAAVLCATAAVVTLVRRPESGLTEVLLGCGLYLVGGFGVTAAANVPRNTALETVDPQAPASEEPWRRYLAEWTVWNHIRCGAATAALISLVLALTAGR